MKIAVIGATGTAGSRVVAKLRDKGLAPVEVSRSTGVDLISGAGLAEALDGVEVVVDASNAFPADPGADVVAALVGAARNVAEASAEQGVRHLVFLSILGIEDPVFDGFPYYVAKRGQEDAVRAAAVPATIVKSSQWYEFATNPSAVVFADEEVVVQDWLVQPVAVDAVADVLVEAALGEPGPDRLLTGPEEIRLPDLTGRLLARRGDARPVRAAAPGMPELAEGVLRAPAGAEVRGPDAAGWLATQ